MARRLWKFFVKKIRKESGVRRYYPHHVWWALAYTYDWWKYLKSQ